MIVNRNYKSVCVLFMSIIAFLSQRKLFTYKGVLAILFPEDDGTPSLMVPRQEQDVTVTGCLYSHVHRTFG